MPSLLSSSVFRFTGNDLPGGRFSFVNKIAATLFLVGSGDFLLRDGGIEGWAFGLYGLLLLGTVVTLQRDALREPGDLVTLFYAASMAVVWIYAPDPLALALFWAAVVVLALRQRLTGNTALLLANIGWHGMTAWLQPLFDVQPLLKAWRRRSQPQTATATWRAAALPLLGTAIFAFLFADANPLLEEAFDAINPLRLLTELDMDRIAGWTAMGVISWSLLRARLARLPWTRTVEHASVRPLPLFLTPVSILASLVLFNAIFAIQNALDIAFLWGGADLPQGLTHAQYAHRGAYTLIATALLSAALVLLMFPGRPAAQAPARARRLVYLWIGQNIFLVASSAQRLLDYVDVYALSLWRLSAFIWLGLVAAGFVLIALRIAWQKSSVWLINANLAAAFAVLYVAAVLDLSAFVANYNVRHNRIVSERAAHLDICYLRSLGVSALPAVDWLSRNMPATADGAEIDRLRSDLVRQAEANQANWRRWTLRDRLNLWRVETAPLRRFPMSNAAGKVDRLRTAIAAPGLPPATVTPYGAAGSIVMRAGSPG